jgi:hypothetical protein
VLKERSMEAITGQEKLHLGGSSFYTSSGAGGEELASSDKIGEALPA